MKDFFFRRIFVRLKKKRIFVDMDGTLALWQETPFEEVQKPGYFKSRPAMENMIQAVKELIGEYEIYILSAVLPDDHSQSEKNEWLDRYIPEINNRHRIFVPYGKKKADYIERPTPDDMLIDDFSINLHSWHGIGVKCMNGINGNHGTWQGNKVLANADSRQIADTIRRIGGKRRWCYRQERKFV